MWRKIKPFLPTVVAECHRWFRNRSAAEAQNPNFRNLLAEDQIALTDPRGIAKAIRKLKQRPELLLAAHKTRAIITRDRFERLSRSLGIRSFGSDTTYAAKNTLEYNRDAMSPSLESSRPEWIVYPLMGIEQLRKRRKKARVLSVGPRGEYELFALMGIGFLPENVYGLDLFSYSPLIEIGDMHEMPFSDDFFDCMVLGWVWSYSTNWSKLAEEIFRCSRDKAILAISADYSSPESSDEVFDGTATHTQSCDDILNSFGDGVSNVYFRHDAAPPDTECSMVIFEIRK